MPNYEWYLLQHLQEELVAVKEDYSFVVPVQLWNCARV